MNENNQVSDKITASSSPITAPVAYNGVTKLLSVILATFLIVYCVCLFKHISYPLMWADESMTAVGAQRVLDYGYPKVHDGRNVFYDLRHYNRTLGIDEKTDAYIGGAGWFPYYFTAPFVALSRVTSDLYLKTAILRFPFAIAGFAGLLLLLWTVIRSLEGQLSRLLIALLFVLLELPSVTLMLHLREVRYYSLQLLLTAVALSVFAAYHMQSELRYRTYAVAVTALIPLLYMTFSPAALAFFLTVSLYLGGEWLLSSSFMRDVPLPSTRFGLYLPLKPAIPILVSLVFLVPLAWFFNTLYISQQLDYFYGFTLATYIEHLSVVVRYFARYDIIVFAIAAKLLLAMFWQRLRKETALLPAFRLSLFFTMYFVHHALIVGKIPNELFTRYFITLNPILILTFAIDLLILGRLSLEMNFHQKVASATLVAVLAVGSTGWAFTQNWQLIRGRLYEVSHQYRGVLDFVIPYMQEHNKHPDQLVIATNYEETSYIFYLGCRVIVGFVNPDFQTEQSERPDYVVYRKFWSALTDKDVYKSFFRHDNYERVLFPVYEYGFNNIPETVHWTPKWGWNSSMHLFKTAYTYDQNKQATIYINRDKLYAQKNEH